MQRIIMHIDFNSYFASCEQQENVLWRHKPVGVCEHLGGIIIAPSIEAKRWGIKTGTPVWEARQLYPKIILTNTHPDRYRLYTKKFLEVLGDYTDRVEKYSIDEAFLDITKACNVKVKSLSNFAKASSDKKFKVKKWEAIDPFVEAENIAKEIKKRITVEVGDYLTCSVGIGWNKLVAKIASDMQKPDGLVIFKPEDKEKLYSKLKLTDIPGIAKRQERNLNILGIKTLVGLREYSVGKLVSRFGIMGYHLHRMGQLEGTWKEDFSSNEQLKSIGHVYTVEREFRNKNLAQPVLYKLCEMVGVRLRANKFLGSTVHVHLWSGEEYVGKGKKLDYLLDDGRDIFFECKGILKSILGAANGQVNWPTTVRQIGVTVSGLLPSYNQLSLFPFDEKKQRMVSAMDSINQKYEGKSISVGKQTSKLGDNHEGVNKGFTVARLPVHMARNVIRDSIGFGRMKEFKTSPGVKQDN